MNLRTLLKAGRIALQSKGNKRKILFYTLKFLLLIVYIIAAVSGEKRRQEVDFTLVISLRIEKKHLTIMSAQLESKFSLQSTVTNTGHFSLSPQSSVCYKNTHTRLFQEHFLPSLATLSVLLLGCKYFINHFDCGNAGKMI